ncbi:MAG: hypothetical protein MR643_01890, partial [Clostridiales bacterium]|nr:hypothetical protein [Clostridiales bacterium]
ARDKAVVLHILVRERFVKIVNQCDNISFHTLYYTTREKDIQGIFCAIKKPRNTGVFYLIKTFYSGLLSSMVWILFFGARRDTTLLPVAR